MVPPSYQESQGLIQSVPSDILYSRIWRPADHHHLHNQSTSILFLSSSRRNYSGLINRHLLSTQSVASKKFYSRWPAEYRCNPRLITNAHHRSDDPHQHLRFHPLYLQQSSRRSKLSHDEYMICTRNDADDRGCSNLYVQIIAFSWMIRVLSNIGQCIWRIPRRVWNTIRGKEILVQQVEEEVDKAVVYVKTIARKVEETAEEVEEIAKMVERGADEMEALIDKLQKTRKEVDENMDDLRSSTKDIEHLGTDLSTKGSKVGRHGKPKEVKEDDTPSSSSFTLASQLWFPFLFTHFVVFCLTKDFGLCNPFVSKLTSSRTLTLAIMP